MLILGQQARSASMLTSVILIQCDTWTSWKLNKDPDFVLSLHFSQYFNACPGLAILSLPAKDPVIETWALSTITTQAFSWKWRVRESGHEIGTDIRVGRVRTALSRRRTVGSDSCWELPQKLSRVKMTRHILCVKMAHKHKVHSTLLSTLHGFRIC